MAYQGAFSKHVIIAFMACLVTAPALAQAPKPKHTQIPMSLKDKMAFVGTYKMANEKNLTIALVAGQLQAQVDGQAAAYIYPESPTQFYYQNIDTQISFVLGAGGKAKSLTMHSGTRNLTAARIGK
jgi:hypothetical protein